MLSLGDSRHTWDSGTGVLSVARFADIIDAGKLNTSEAAVTVDERRHDVSAGSLVARSMIKVVPTGYRWVISYLACYEVITTICRLAHKKTTSWRAVISACTVLPRCQDILMKYRTIFHSEWVVHGPFS